MSPVTIFRSFSLAEAHLVRGRLEAAGFLATLLHEHSTLGLEGYSLAAGGFRVQVPENEARDARVLIKSDQAAT